MQFAAVAALFATAVAGNVVYETQYHTITSCAPEVTNCPARSTVTSSTVYAVSTPAAGYPVSSPVAASPAVPVAPTGGKPAGPYDTASAPYPTSSAVQVQNVASSSPAQPATSGYPVSVQTISTCIPTVIYSTITMTPPAPTSVKPAPSAGFPNKPSAGLPPKPTPTYPVTAGAANVGASVFAAAAGLAAFALI